MSLTFLKRRPCNGEAQYGDPHERTEALFCRPRESRPCITICDHQEGCAHDCKEVRHILEEEIKTRDLDVLVGSMKVGCDGDCPYGPLVGFPRRGFFYRQVTPERARDVVCETLLNGHILFDLLHMDPFKSTSGRMLYDRGSGFIAAIDDSFCMVQVARYFLKFEEGVSCGKCVPCRLGSVELAEILDRIIQGKGRPEDLQRLNVTCLAMQNAPYCDFARVSSGPVVSAIKYFRSEFSLHIDKGICPAGACEGLTGKKQDQKEADQI